MKLLDEITMNKYGIKPTGEKKKMKVANKMELLNVYEVPLDLLFYNEQNDRIATWISKYKAENGVDSLNIDDKNDYNDLIHSFIKESNPDALEKTKNNIDIMGQIEPGVVLLDGRIIDGNRRYTCLRILQKETSKPQYFKTYILNESVSSNKKEIKRLELQLQHGKEKPLDYNPIDKLVGIYNDIIESKMFTIEEYADEVNEKPNKIRKEVEIAQLMVEFLDYIDAPEEFYIARQLELDGPLREIPGILKKCKNSEQEMEVKNNIFSDFILMSSGDKTRVIRKYKDIISDDDVREDFIENRREFVDKVSDLIDEKENTDLSKICEIRTENVELQNEMESSLELWKEKANSNSIKNRPNELLEQAYGKLESIDTRIFDKLKKEQLEETKESISKIKMIIEEIEKEI